LQKDQAKLYCGSNEQQAEIGRRGTVSGDTSPIPRDYIAASKRSPAGACISSPDPFMSEAPLVVLLSQSVAAFAEKNHIFEKTHFSAWEGAEMGLQRSGDVASRFSAFVDGLMSVIGHAARAKPLRDYCTGLMMPCDRKSVEPMAAMTAPDRTAAQHQSLLHFVGQGDWSDQQVLAKVREILPDIERHGPIEAWIIDDTGFPKKGRHSVGVARQYCGQLGKQDNCQVAVTLSLANHHASLPVAYRLYLPKEWVTDRIR
jgi:hypothetical protein